MSAPAPLRAAAPFLGSRGGRRFGPADRRFSTRSSLLTMGLMGLACLAGMLRQVPCFDKDWSLPFAAHRMCASPIANAATPAAVASASALFCGRTASGSLMTLLNLIR